MKKEVVPEVQGRPPPEVLGKKDMAHERKCEVVLLNDSVLVFSIQPKMLALDLFDLVSSHFGLREKEYFGLHFKDDTGLPSWLHLERKILDQDIHRKANPIRLYFAVRYYIESIRYLQCSESVELFYLQARRGVLDERFECASESVFQLAAYALQAADGNYVSLDAVHQQLIAHDLLPTSTLREHPSIDYCTEEVGRLHQSLSGLTRGQAIVNYMNTVEQLPTYGIHYYEVQDKAGLPWWLGISYKGIAQYDHNDKVTPRKVFQWQQLENLYFRDKKFSIEVHDTKRNGTAWQHFVSVSRRAFGPSSVNVHAWLTSKAQHTKTIWSMAVHQHQFYLDRRQAKNGDSVSRSMNDVASDLDTNSSTTAVVGPGTAVLKTKVSSSSMSITSTDAMVVDNVRAKAISPDSKSLSSSHSSKVDLTVEQQAAQREIFLGLKAQRGALARALLEKQRLLQTVCLQEAELTGTLPEDYPLLPGDKELPAVKKRVGTSFTINVDNGAELQQEDRVSRTREIQMDYDLQVQITKALHRLASDQTLPKKARKTHRAHYEQAKAKLDDLEKRLADCKAFTTDDFAFYEEGFAPILDYDYDMMDVRYPSRSGIRLLKGSDRMRSSPQLEELSYSPGMRRRAPSAGSMRFASNQFVGDLSPLSTPTRLRAHESSQRLPPRDLNNIEQPDFTPSNMLTGGCRNDSSRTNGLPPSPLTGSRNVHPASGSYNTHNQSSNGSGSQRPGRSGRPAQPRLPHPPPPEGDDISITTVNSTHSHASSNASLQQLHAYSVSGARPLRAGSADDIREGSSSVSGSSTGAASGSPVYQRSSHRSQQPASSQPQQQQQWGGNQRDRRGLTDSPNSITSGGSGGGVRGDGVHHPYSPIRQREELMYSGAGAGGNTYNSLERTGRRRQTPPVGADMGLATPYQQQDVQYNRTMTRSDAVSHLGGGPNSRVPHQLSASPTNEHARARSPGRYPTPPSSNHSASGSYNSLGRRGNRTRLQAPSPQNQCSDSRDTSHSRGYAGEPSGADIHRGASNYDASYDHHSQTDAPGEPRYPTASLARNESLEPVRRQNGTAPNGTPPPARPVVDYPVSTFDRMAVSGKRGGYEEPQEYPQRHQLQHPQHMSHSLGRPPKNSSALSLAPSMSSSSQLHFGADRPYRTSAQPEYRSEDRYEVNNRDQNQYNPRQDNGQDGSDYMNAEFRHHQQDQSSYNQQQARYPGSVKEVDYRREPEPQQPIAPHSALPPSVTVTANSEGRDSPQSDIDSAAFMFDTRQHISPPINSSGNAGKGGMDGDRGAPRQPQYSRTPAPQTPARPYKVNGGNGGGNSVPLHPSDSSEPYQSLLAGGGSGVSHSDDAQWRGGPERPTHFQEQAGGGVYVQSQYPLPPRKEHPHTARTSDRVEYNASYNSNQLERNDNPVYNSREPYNSIAAFCPTSSSTVLHVRSVSSPTSSNASQQLSSHNSFSPQDPYPSIVSPSLSSVSAMSPLPSRPLSHALSPTLSITAHPSVISPSLSNTSVRSPLSSHPLSHALSPTLSMTSQSPFYHLPFTPPTHSSDEDSDHPDMCSPFAVFAGMMNNNIPPPLRPPPHAPSAPEGGVKGGLAPSFGVGDGHHVGAYLLQSARDADSSRYAATPPAVSANVSMRETSFNVSDHGNNFSREMLDWYSDKEATAPKPATLV